MIRLAAAVLAALVLAGCSSGSTGGGAGDMSVASSPVPPVSTQPAPKRTAPSLYDRMRRWANSNTEKDLGAIGRGMGAVSRAANRGDVAALTNACDQIEANAIAVDGDPPAPDQAVRRELAIAMRLTHAATRACLNADYAAFNSYVNVSTTHIARATARIRQLTG